MRNVSEKRTAGKLLRASLYSVLLIIMMPLSATVSVMFAIITKYRRIIPRSFIEMPEQLKQDRGKKSMPEIMKKINGVKLQPGRSQMISTFGRSLANLLPALLETGGQTAGILYPYPNAFLPIVIQSGDGTPVCGVLAMQPCEEERPGLVLVHDFLSSKNSYEIEKMALRAYYEWGFHVFAIDLRCSGDTNRLSGAPSSWGYREAEDILSSVEYLDSVENVGAVGICGIGLGASAAIIAGGREEAESLIRGGIVAISPYSDAGRTIRYLSDPGRGTIGHFFSSLALNTLVKLKTAINGPYRIKNFENYTREISSQYYELGENALYEKASPVKFIDRLHSPCLIIHSRNDNVIPVGEVEELLFNARNNPMVDSVMLPCGGHGKYSVVYPESFHETIRTFLVYWTGFDPEPETWVIGANQGDLPDNKGT
ncbi:MAG: hypothetical protein JW738_01160 [Actinobacteria bacterium]|nr:hypothetical protein [Actinomycetota bacterium]